MAGQEEPLLRLAGGLMEAEGPEEFFRNLASTVRDEMDADWTAVWVYGRRRKAFSLEVSFPPGVISPRPEGAGREEDLLGESVARKKLVIRRGGAVRESTLQHLETPGRPLPGEVFCVPFTLDRDRLGLLEVVREGSTPPEGHPDQVRFLSACSALVSSAAASMGRLHAGREKQLAVINRLMQLYDVSRVFHSTLDRDSLLPAIADRIGLILEASLCRIWLPAEEGEGLRTAFPDPGGETQGLPPGEGVPGIAFQSGESVLIPDAAEAEDPAGIRAFYGADGAGSILCSPLVEEENRLGVVEVVRPPGKPGFTEEDRDFLEELSRQASIALRNANLFLAEKKARELDALLDISREITATLDLDRVLKTVVNRADDIVPSDRCAILLAEGREMEIRAVSGTLEVDRRDPRVRDLEEILTWTFLSGRGHYISELEGEIETDREETRQKFLRYFQRSGMKTFVGIPLKDEEGLLGVLSIESDQPYFVSEDKLEIFNILANQATVAIRNASLYRRIPLIHIMEPIAGWKSRLKAVPLWKWFRNAGVAAALVALLVFVPWNMKIVGKVVVLPTRNATVTTEIQGVVEAVFRREGDRVKKGDLLATLMDKDYRVRLEEVRSDFDIAGGEVAESEARLDLAAASQARIRRERFREEMELLRYRLEKTKITSPVDGVVITPRLERRVGLFLEKGEEFCRVADMRQASVEILVPETEIAAVREGQEFRLKVDSFPTETFRGRVEIVGQKVLQEGGRRFLIVRGRVNRGGLPLKTGMLGRAKIEVGRRNLGYVLFRKPARSLWRILWRWLP